MSKAFGKRLRETRRRAGLSQSVLAARLGGSKALISRYENGHVEPSLATLTRIADALGVSERSLLTDDVTPKDEFIELLMSRGVVLRSRQDAHILGDSSADIARARGMTDESASESVSS